MKDINLTTVIRILKKPLALIERYHVTIVIVLIFGVLILAVSNVNNTLSQPPDEAYRQQAEQNALQTHFDQDTIKKVDRLKYRQENPDLSLPAGRNNPFKE